MSENLYTIMRTLNQIYGIGYRRTATPPTADLLIARVKAMTPQKYSLLLKAIRGDESIPAFHAYGTFKVKSDGAQPVIEGIASSTRQDLDGDIMSETALRDLLGLKGTTAMIGHRYAWPEDILGMVTATSLRKTGNVTALAVAINIAQDNPRAMQSYAMLKSGTRGALSIGCIVLESTTIDVGKGRKALQIDRLMPLEVSLVGIGSNMDSWVTNAKSALKSISGRR